MPKIDATVVQKYQMMLGKDPNSQVFAPLAEAYREMGQMAEAEVTARQGVQRHPNFPGGLVTLGKILRDQQKLEEALIYLQKVTQIAPENILSHLLSAEIFLQLKNGKEALRCFKMVLLFNPKHEKAQAAVRKLESLTADEYEEELFQMTRLRAMPAHSQGEMKSARDSKKSEEESVVTRISHLRLQEGLETPLEIRNQKAVERLLSLVDAFIVRNDLDRAKALLMEAEKEFGISAEIQKRLDLLQANASHEEEIATPLEPLEKRSEKIREKKIFFLNQLLHQIEQRRTMGFN